MRRSRGGLLRTTVDKVMSRNCRHCYKSIRQGAISLKVILKIAWLLSCISRHIKSITMITDKELLLQRQTLTVLLKSESYVNVQQCLSIQLTYFICFQNLCRCPLIRNLLISIVTRSRRGHHLARLDCSSCHLVSSEPLFATSRCE